MSKWIAEFDLEDGDTMPEHMDLEYKGARIDFHCRPLEQKPTIKNDLGVREFEEIVVEYPPKDLCIYPEYKGKPYFSIKYKEGNDYIIGYGTYNPKVLSRYLTDYFMPPVTPQEPILDEIRAEIERGKTGLDIEFNGGIDYALSIIDKYKADSEAQESEDT